MSDRRKSLGNLSPDHLARLLALQEVVHCMARALPEILDKPRFKRLVAREGVFFQWSWAYEFQFAEMLALGLTAIGETGFIVDGARSEDPLESVISHAEKYDPGLERVRPTQLLQGIAHMVASYHSMRAIELYARSLNKLLADGRGGDDEAFIKAVRVDPTCMSSPSLAKRMSLASMMGDKRFTKRLYKAAIEGPNKGLLVFRRLRYSTVLLKEAGAFSSGNREHIFEVLVGELGLYEQKKGDPFKSLFRNLDLWKKSAAT